MSEKKVNVSLNSTKIDLSIAIYSLVWQINGDSFQKNLGMPP
jgi:hypothetical protein